MQRCRTRGRGGMIPVLPGTPHTYLPCDQISGMCSNFYVFYDVIKGKKRVIKMSRPSCHTLKDRYNIFDTLRKLHAHIRLLAIQPGICGSSLWHHKRVRNDQNCKRCSPQTMVVPQAQGVWWQPRRFGYGARPKAELTPASAHVALRSSCVHRRRGQGCCC